jgi:hypothetical protein
VRKEKGCSKKPLRNLAREKQKAKAFKKPYKVKQKGKTAN